MSIIEEGVFLSDYDLEMTAWLQECFDLYYLGKETQITSDPFYEREPGKSPITDDDVTRVINAIESEYDEELSKYANYHRNRSGANALPGYNLMPLEIQRRIVEGCDMIRMRHGRKSGEEAKLNQYNSVNQSNWESC